MIYAILEYAVLIGLLTILAAALYGLIAGVLFAREAARRLGHTLRQLAPRIAAALGRQLAHFHRFLPTTIK
jgi:hypothetical protein